MKPKKRPKAWGVPFVGGGGKTEQGKELKSSFFYPGEASKGAGEFGLLGEGGAPNKVEVGNLEGGALKKKDFLALRSYVRTRGGANRNLNQGKKGRTIQTETVGKKYKLLQRDKKKEKEKKGGTGNNYRDPGPQG